MLIFVKLFTVVASAVITSAYTDDDGVLYYTRYNAIMKRGMRPDATETELLSIGGCEASDIYCQIGGINFDCKEGKIYFSNLVGSWIKTANSDGSDVKTPFTFESPRHMAIDWSSKNIYYTVDGDRLLTYSLVVASLDGKYKKVLVHDISFPERLVIDLENRHLYFTHRIARLSRINLDGTGFVTLVTDEKLRAFFDDSDPFQGLVLLPKRQELCWFNTVEKPYFLQCMNLHSKVRRTVFVPSKTQQVAYPWELTAYKEKRFFWINSLNNAIHSVTVDGDQYFSFRVNATEGPFGLLHLLAEPPPCPEVTTACAVNNGGCPYLCLPTDTGAKCVCPDEPKGLKGC